MRIDWNRKQDGQSALGKSAVNWNSWEKQMGGEELSKIKSFFYWFPAILIFKHIYIKYSIKPHKLFPQICDMMDLMGELAYFLKYTETSI